ncbi:MAG: acyl-CoA reductase [Saprospiraceae bacterium]|nr:acyl-CoA reductase [Saprospiraceae bacterium]
MHLHERINALTALGEHLLGEDDYLRAVMHRTYHNNLWFTPANQEQAVKAIAQQFLDSEKLQNWLSQYEIPEPDAPKTVGLVMAGNLPLVGFHDVMCVFAAGHKAKIKLSEKDAYLLPYLLKVLEKIDLHTVAYFEIADRLHDLDATIATGSNNTARYFEAYFGNKPHIIRKNRNAGAVLSGAETDAELLALGSDIFSYFGMGCRNVSKLYAPRGYDFIPLLELLTEYREVVLHDKYKNNFDYNLALCMLSREPYLMGNGIVLIENAAIASPVSCLYYEFYDSITDLEAELNNRSAEIQCIVANAATIALSVVPFGKAQQPGLEDYADGVDTMAFLTKL